MKDEQALRPGSFTISDFIKQDIQEDLGLSEEEKILSQGKHTAFWKTLREYLNNEIQQLEQIQDSAIANGASRDQIGENAVVISLTRGVLKRIVNRVEDAREAKDGK